MPPINYTILVLGDHRSGKTTWIKRLKTGMFYASYTPTPGHAQLTWETPISTGQTVKFTLIEVDANLESLNADYGVVHGAVIFLDGLAALPRRKQSHAKWYRMLTARYPEIPLGCYQTKADVVWARAREALKMISSENCHGLYTPLVELTREIRDDPTITFDGPGEVTPTIPPMTMSMRNYEKKTLSRPLPPVEA